MYVSRLTAYVWLLLLLFSMGSALVPMAGSQGSMSGESYYVVSTSSDLTVYPLDENYGVITWPLRDLLGERCLGESSEGFVRQIWMSLLKNVSLSNGGFADELWYEVLYYAGCSSSGVRLGDVVWMRNPDNLTLASLHLYGRAPNLDEYVIPLIMAPGRMLIAYKYVNESYFETDIILNIHPVFAGNVLAGSSYDLTIRFLVDSNSWTAWLIDGDELINVGVLPLAPPTLNVAEAIYLVYQNYLSSAKYYLEHPQELQMVVDKVRNLYNMGLSENATEELMDIVRTPREQVIWGGYSVPYLGKWVKIYVDQLIDPEAFNLVIPSYKYFTMSVNHTLIQSISGSIEDAVREYLETGSARRLEELISSNDPIYFRERTSPAYTNSLFFVAIPAPPFIVMSSLPALFTALPLPRGNPLERFGARYIFLDGSVVESFSNVSLTEGASWNDVIGFANWSNSNIAVAIDSRLAKRWLLYTNNSLDPEKRLSILYNLGNAIASKYLEAWWAVIKGGDPGEAFNKFLNDLYNSVIETAYMLGGDEGVELIRDMISAGTGSAGTPTIPNTTTPYTGAAGNTTSNVISSGGQAGSILQYLPAVGLVVAVVVAGLFIAMRRLRSRR